ncbi:hypothetical protein [Anaerotruncus sp. AF02-27]|uniref:hypothetical protein n=1 Tax=Anaerotruncus sp. AF02-27 TaxID=2292191 RepID=UPI0013146C47|nr:hypothetical protein [Anaerotruncus sp. AF02-27]
MKKKDAVLLTVPGPSFEIAPQKSEAFFADSDRSAVKRCLDRANTTRNSGSIETRGEQ